MDNITEAKVAKWEGRYAIGADGAVYSTNYSHTGETKALKQHLNRKGYPYVVLCIDGVRKKWVVHRLVALAFIPNPDSKPHVNHKNGIRSDSRVENLEWVTASENALHSYRVLGRRMTDEQREFLSRKASGENSPHTSLTCERVREMREQKRRGIPTKDIAKQVGMGISQTNAILQGRAWRGCI